MARFQTLKICLSMLSLFNKYMKSMSEILAADELYFTAAYPDLHIWSICILGSQHATLGVRRLPVLWRVHLLWV